MMMALPRGMLVSVRGVRARVEFRIERGEPLGEYSLYREDGGGRFTACLCQIRLLEEIETVRERTSETLEGTLEGATSR